VGRDEEAGAGGLGFGAAGSKFIGCAREVVAIRVVTRIMWGVSGLVHDMQRLSGESEFDLQFLSQPNDF